MYPSVASNTRRARGEGGTQYSTPRVKRGKHHGRIFRPLSTIPSVHPLDAARAPQFRAHLVCVCVCACVPACPCFYRRLLQLNSRGNSTSLLGSLCEGGRVLQDPVGAEEGGLCCPLHGVDVVLHPCYCTAVPHEQITKRKK